MNIKIFSAEREDLLEEQYNTWIRRRPDVVNGLYYSPLKTSTGVRFSLLVAYTPVTSEKGDLQGHTTIPTYRFDEVPAQDRWLTDVQEETDGNPF